MNLLLALELIYIILIVRASEFDEEVYMLHKDKPDLTSDAHKQQKKKNLQSGQDSAELSLPLFPEWDGFSINGLDRKLKESSRVFQGEKDVLTDITENTQHEKIWKTKQRPKDKFVMTFTEYFVPVINHKNFDFPSFPRKLDFFDDFFKDFSFKNLEEQPLQKHKSQRRFFDFNPFFSFIQNTSSKISDLLNSNVTSSNLTKKFETRKSGTIFKKPNDAILLLQNKENETETIPIYCAHTECRTNMDCKKGTPNEQHEEENMYMSRLKYIANMNQLSRMMLIYAIPILLGIGGIIIAIEIIRKHNNSVKKMQFPKQYDPIQHC